MNVLVFIIAGLILLAVYGGAAFYVGKRLYRWLAAIFPKTNAKVFAVVFTILMTLVIMAHMPIHVTVRYIMRTAAGYWTGIFVYLFMLFVVADVVLAIGRLCKLTPVHMRDKVRFYAGTAVIVLTAIVVGWGIYNARQLSIVTYEVELQRSVDGEMNIVFISDLHLGEVRSESGLERMVEYINSLNPDIVCLIGDIFNDDFYAIRNPERAAEVLRGIDATFGVFACLGNHDAGRTIGSMINFLEQSNIRLLNEEYAIIDDRLVLIGRFDEHLTRINALDGVARGEFSDIMDVVHADLLQRSLSLDLPIVVIDHNPTHISEYGSDVDLALFGHTHGGALFPATLVTRALFVIDRGHFQQDSYSPHIIVTQGVSTWLMPVRVGSRNEIASVIVR